MARSNAGDALSLEHIPLSQRRKFSRSNATNSHSQSPQKDRRTPSFEPPLDTIVKKEFEDFDSQVTCSTVQNDASGVEKTSVNASILSRCSRICNEPATMKVDSVDNGRNASLQLGFPAVEVKKEICDSIDDDLDHMTLKERLRLLLARRLPGSSSTTIEAESGGLSENILKQTPEHVNGEICSVDEKTTAARDLCRDTPEGSNRSPIELPLGAASGSGSFLSTECESSKIREMTERFDSHDKQGAMPIDNDGPSSSTCPTSVKIKDEPMVNSEIDNVCMDAMGNISVKLPNVKREWKAYNEFDVDQVEHMSLSDRLNLLMAREDSSLNISTSYPSLKTTMPFPMSRSKFSESTEPSCIKSTRKRKKTATDSVEKALEEDAPGLLQVLLDKGIVVGEIKLYGETEKDKALDESFCEDGFSELEAVITKIFSQRPSFIKFPIIRAAKGSRASYCLACLISLVEQTRYLRFQNWPVEWGWCRDLQSFIFVFQRHNRIVLERPEYGYATYFFELVQSIPVEWQIKRLVIAMKLTTCSRISIIENKELSVGDDLSEVEAKVLMEYGWTPNTGLGTMLNYRDRVVHDRNKEDVSEWRSKMGKMLVDGYSGGTIVTNNIPKKVAEYRCSQTPKSDE